MADIIDVNIGDQVLEVYWQDEVELNLDMALMYIKSGQKEIDDYVENVSKPEIRDYVETEAKPLVSRIVTEIAEPTVSEYIKTTVKPEIDDYVEDKKPELQAFVTQAQGFANDSQTSAEASAASAGAAETALITLTTTATDNFNTNASEKQAQIDASASAAYTSETNAKTSETNSKQSENNSKIWAEGTDSEVQGLGGVHSSKGWSEAAQAVVDGKQDIETAVNYTNITNCITEIPQDIKLELNNGTLTLKAGSKAYDGAGNVINVTSDATVKNTGSAPMYLCVQKVNKGLWVGYMTGGTVTERPSQPIMYAPYYNTTTKVCEYWNGSVWTEVSLPIAIVTRGADGFTSIDQVFNGFGYIGSTIFALPGVKGLIPNGRKTDGSLRSIEFTVNSVKTFNNTVIRTNSNLTISQEANIVPQNILSYDDEKNLNISVNNSVVTVCKFATWKADSTGRITSFAPKTAFHALDYNDVKDVIKATGGGGLEIGDIGFAPLGIDETQNKRRYLNGQVISQTQFVTFTDKVKKAVALYPSLSATEENWQAEVTNSKLGQCGKFVIDDTAGTIRLPKVVNINGLTDLSLLGGIKAESLPNIKGTFYGRQNGLTGGSGAFYDGNNPYGGMGSGSYNNAMNFDASRSSSTYQDNAPVQQEAVQYPYFIQVATGSEESVDVTREIELNNPFSLFDSKWADHELSNASWVKSNGTFYSGATYVTAYNELLTEYNNAASVEKTDGSITYKLTPKRFKIALASQDTAITELYNNTGVAWYYVLDTANTQFKLPCTKWGFVGIRNAVGNYVAESLPNITGHFGEVGYGDTNNYSGAFYKYGTGGSNGSFNTSRQAWFPGFNASRSSSAYQDGAPVQQRATEMYLYFYVGETIQDANVINAAGVLTTVANKANADMSNVNPEWASAAGKPSGRNINLTLGATGSNYTAPANGYFTVVLNCGGKWANITTSTGLYNAYGNSNYANANFPVKKGDKITIAYESGVTANIFKFIYDEGAKQ